MRGYGPIMVVRPAVKPDGPVLVGFDGSEAAYAAVQFGVQEALGRSVPLEVANAYWEQPWGWHEQPAIDPVVTARRHAEQMITDALEFDSRAVSRTGVRHPCDSQPPPPHSLVEESFRASLTVVGSRGRAGSPGCGSAR